jgi:hypothetical protein
MMMRFNNKTALIVLDKLVQSERVVVIADGVVYNMNITDSIQNRIVCTSNVIIPTTNQIIVCVFEQKQTLKYILDRNSDNEFHERNIPSKDTAQLKLSKTPHTDGAAIVPKRILTNENKMKIGDRIEYKKPVKAANIYKDL